MRVLAIDASLRNTGVAIVDANNGRMHALLQTFQRNFRFFHAFNCKIANRLFKIEWT